MHLIVVTQWEKSKDTGRLLRGRATDWITRPFDCLIAGEGTEVGYWGIIQLDRPMTLDPQVEHRLQTEQNLWLATVRPNGAPHLVPIWFVWVTGRFYFCTGADSVKARNLVRNPYVSVALEDGSRPIVIEGQAQAIGQADAAVIAEFQRKYDWDITSDDTYTQVIEIEPTKIRS